MPVCTPEPPWATPGLKVDKRGWIAGAAVDLQRERSVFLVLHGRADDGVCGVELGRRGFDGNRLVRGTYRQLKLEADNLECVNRDIFLGQRLESLCRDRHGVGAGGNRREGEDAARRRRLGHLVIGGIVGCGHACASDDSSRWIGNCPGYRTLAADLGGRRRSERQADYCHKHYRRSDQPECASCQVSVAKRRKSKHFYLHFVRPKSQLDLGDKSGNFCQGFAN